MLARDPSIAAAGFDLLGGLSVNGQSVAWTTAGGTVYVADRPTATAPFGAPTAVMPPSIRLNGGRVALSPTGLELIAVLANGSSFVHLVRPSVGVAWAPTDGTEFATLASMISETGGAFSEPVSSGSGLSLFYLLALPPAPPALYESQFANAAKAWGVGRALPNQEFAIASTSSRRRPTGASFDNRTLFFFDEALGHERAAWRDSPLSPFSEFRDLPALPGAVPVEDCTTLYFHGSDAAGQGLFTAKSP
jgi:hypothetical protein